MKNSNYKIIAVIQARMGSTRLPKKALIDINGKNLTEWINYRLSFAKNIDGIVLSTADTKENDALAEFAAKIGLPCYRGSETDLVSRLLNTAKEFSADAIVRVTGDCPLVDAKIIDEMVETFLKDRENIDYMTNVFPPTFPDGLDLEIIPVSTLEKMDREITKPLYREWLTVYIMENPDKFKIRNFENKENLAHLRLTVDFPEDFELVKTIFNKLYRPDENFYLPEILGLFKDNPELYEINKMHVDNALVDNIRSQSFQDLKNNAKDN